MSIMKPCLMTISILLILVHKTPGGLFRSSYGKSQEPWNPCQVYHGMCRNACRKYEIQYFTCPNDQKCCLKLSVKTASSNHAKEDYNADSN
ncbi:PREDICTED: beta-defensin 116 [Ceratotherium simum simum]|uniref:Beta-defensin n=1 Tax=Ceratotherium simum simum TaxID=73337 RepID=A0ABM0I8F4_CERSS|nr:PREDICTED: beta-defensin 116 [Ceratotherium simum simum]